jgi:pilus assembly protein CpaB
MRGRTLVLLLLAVLLAGGTALLARSWLANQQTAAELKAAPVPLAAPSKSVLVAHAPLNRGQILRPEDVSWQVWPEGGIDKSYVVLGGPRTPQSFAGWVAKNPIGSGEPITDGNVVAPGNRGFLAAVLRPGMRAISVPVTVTSGISGFIFPGDQVDLMLTFSVPPTPGAGQSNFDHKVAETVLRDIRVIAIDQRLQSKPGEAVPAHTATFEVTPKQSEVIALASKVGEVSLTLRSLVATPSETAVTDQSAAATADQSSPDSSVGATASYTVDSEISPLLPKYRSGKEAPESAVITILRGGGKGSESIAAQPASPQPAAQPGSKGM